MTVNAVTTAIRHAHQVIGEWEEAGRYLDGVQWREDHTRYALIDPILRGPWGGRPRTQSNAIPNTPGQTQVEGSIMLFSGT